MQIIVLKCKQGSLFRLGNGSLTDVSRIIHSDTLFSAITNIYELVYGAGDEFINLVENEKITLSSAFPALEKVETGEFIYFIPKPEILFEQSEILENRIKYISLNVYKKVVELFNSETVSTSINPDQLVYIDNTFCLLKSEAIASEFMFMSEHTYPKKAVHKASDEDAFYYQTDLQLVPVYDMKGKVCYKPHFYFYIKDTLTNNEKSRFITCLRILADEGIGGDRGSGRGLFEDVEIKESEVITESVDHCFMAMSLVNPASQDEFDDCIHYDVITRGGGSIGLQNDYEKHRLQVRMITEGSIFGSEAKGRIVDVSPPKNSYNHSIYRNGKAFVIPIG